MVVKGGEGGGCGLVADPNSLADPPALTVVQAGWCCRLVPGQQGEELLRGAPLMVPVDLLLSLMEY